MIGKKFDKGKPLLIGLAGPKQSGKSTAAKMMNKNHGFYRFSFALPLKKMTLMLLLSLQYDEEEAMHMLNSDKEKVIHEIGRSTRYLMQSLGTEWGRKMVCASLWEICLKKSIEASNHRCLVVDDVRFESEAAMIREMGGFIIHIDRGSLVADEHASEAGIVKHEADFFVDNVSTIDDFLVKVNCVVAGLL